MTTRQHNAFAHRLLAYMGGGVGAGGGGALDIKVKVSAGDTVTDYLAQKLSSADGSVTFTILNPAANEQYDVSIAPIPVTRAAALALIAGNSLAAGRMYLITDAYEIFAGRVCQIFMFAVSTSAFDPNGFGTFTNENTATPLNASFVYDITNNVLTETYFIDTRCTVINSNMIDIVDFNSAILNGSTFISTTFSLTASTVTFNIQNSTIRNCTFNFNDPTQTITMSSCSALNTVFTLSPANCLFESIFDTYDSCAINIGAVGAFTAYSGRFQNSTFESGCNVTVSEGAVIYYSSIGKNAVLNMSGEPQFASSTLDNCTLKQGSNTTIVGNVLTRCVIGSAKVWTTTNGGVNYTNASLEDLDSTFEVFIDPNPAGLLDMNDYKFAGIVRIGQAGAPAAWDLKQINNFPTDHIFCIIPSTDNTVDVYDAGAGGNNIYLSTAAVVTYDGTKDDTLVVRSGLNDYFRLFQIGGWQAPSA